MADNNEDPGSEVWHTVMSYNHSSSYNRTYERKVIEEGGGKPTVRISSPFQTVTAGSGGIPFSIPSLPSSSFITPHNYHFGNCAGSFSSNDDSLNAILDVSGFAPEDLKVSVNGRQIVIEAKHGEKQDELGSIERSFVRKFNLPKNATPESVTSNLTGEGQLTITAQAPQQQQQTQSQTIPIKVQTNGST
ncbi:unnamed protein product [Bursaphelenchus okinawaensis]|uniref:SHSP domain-containing protein n=1 Tax=Bursaphelenchus okinawaensis TaxID=465554 RepID=A0A811KW76_9BILA|nr:unnamed protein product [Bursaphelenchus okinawaensis]CAG9112784.1 unnamed protein product [Bursaphelenchus okinawaensis]